MAALGTLAAPSAASAAVTVIATCDPTIVTPNATACAGYYTGNLINGSPADIANQQYAISQLGGTYTFDGNWGAVETTLLKNEWGDTPFDFGRMLYGETIIGAHFGKGAGFGDQASVFFLFDFGTEGVSSVVLNDTRGWSNAVLYTTGAVPEPAMWMMMILGFGGIGFVMRRRKDISAKPALV